jgi:hypothetical protein
MMTAPENGRNTAVGISLIASGNRIYVIIIHLQEKLK